MRETIRSNLVTTSRLLLAAAALLWGALPADAAPDERVPLRIRMSAPAVCPAEPTLFERVAAHTGRVREARATEAARDVGVNVLARAGGLVAEVSIADAADAAESRAFAGGAPRGASDAAVHRRVPGKGCEEILAAVALIVAVTIDPDAVLEPNTYARADVDARASDNPATHDLDGSAGASIDDAASRESTPVRDERSSLSPPPTRAPSVPREARSFELSMGFAFEARGYGEAVLGRGYWLGGAWKGKWRPSLRLRLSVSDVFRADPGGRPAYFRVTAASVEGCVAAAKVPFGPAAESGTLRVHPCIAMAGGIVEEDSAAYGPVVRTEGPLISPGASLEVRWSLLRVLSLEAGIGAMLPLVRDEFFYRPGLVVYRIPGVVLGGSLGAGIRF